MNGRFPAGKLDPDPRKWKREKGIQRKRKKGWAGGPFFAEPKSRSQVKSRTVWEWRTAPRSRVRQTVRPSPQAPVSELSALGPSSGRSRSGCLLVNECMSERMREEQKAVSGEEM